MAGLRVYKKFYQIINNNYNLLNPYLLTVQIYNASSSVLVESPTVNNDSTGVYYVNLTPLLYNSSDLYEARWNVNYTSSSGLKVLSLFFMYDVSSIINVYNNSYKFGEIVHEITKNKFDIEITNNEPLIVEIKNNNG